MIPDRIDPGCAPDGLVVCTYTLTGECVTEDFLLPGTDVTAVARAASEFVNTILRDGEPFVMAVYDGDTGQRWTPGEMIDRLP